MVRTVTRKRQVAENILDDIKERIKERPNDDTEVRLAYGDVPVLVKTVDVVLALHGWNTDGKCPQCWADYPCDTVTAIRAALEENV